MHHQSHIFKQSLLSTLREHVGKLPGSLCPHLRGTQKTPSPSQKVPAFHRRVRDLAQRVGKLPGSLCQSLGPGGALRQHRELLLIVKGPCLLEGQGTLEDDETWVFLSRE